jgi:Xaa-Pro dipeptidase
MTPPTPSSSNISPLARAPAIAVTEQPFEAAELAGRLARVRAAMAAQGLDLLMVTDPNDIYYLSGARELAGRMQMALLVAGTGAPAFVGRAVDAVAFIAHTGNANTFDYRDHEPPEGALALGVAKMAGAAARVGYNAANLAAGMLARAPVHRRRSTLRLALGRG